MSVFFCCLVELHTGLGPELCGDRTKHVYGCKRIVVMLLPRDEVHLKDGITVSCRHGQVMAYARYGC